MCCIAKKQYTCLLNFTLISLCIQQEQHTMYKSLKINKTKEIILMLIEAYHVHGI